MECETKPCLKACSRARVDKAIDIPFIAEYIRTKSIKPQHEVSLDIDFCGFKCENPFVLASSVIANNYEMCAKALNAGWGECVSKQLAWSPIPKPRPALM